MCAADFNHYSNNYRDILRETLGSFGGSVDFFDPLRLATILGVISSLFSFILAFYIIVLRLIKPFPVPGYLSTFVAITFLGGMQLISIGIIGHYLGYLIDNNRHWPVAFVAETTEGRENGDDSGVR